MPSLKYDRNEKSEITCLAQESNMWDMMERKEI